jgi:hypothetical protein
MELIYLGCDVFEPLSNVLIQYPPTLKLFQIIPDSDYCCEVDEC